MAAKIGIKFERAADDCWSECPAAAMADDEHLVGVAALDDAHEVGGADLDWPVEPGFLTASERAQMRPAIRHLHHEQPVGKRP